MLGSWAPGLAARRIPPGSDGGCDSTGRTRFRFLGSRSATAVISASSTRTRTMAPSSACRDGLLDMAIAWHRTARPALICPAALLRTCGLGGDSGLVAPEGISLSATRPRPRSAATQGTSRGAWLRSASRWPRPSTRDPPCLGDSAENLELTKLLGWTHLSPLITPLPPPTCPPTLLACLLPRPDLLPSRPKPADL